MLGFSSNYDYVIFFNPYSKYIYTPYFIRCYMFAISLSANDQPSVREMWRLSNSVNVARWYVLRQ